MGNVRDVPADKLIPALAEALKKVDAVKPHPSAGLVKSGVNTERPPEQTDFWYLRSAAVLRKLYLTGPVGTRRLRTAFGGKRRRGHKPPHVRKAGGKFIRLMLQQMEKAGFLAKVEKPPYGRVITPKGQKFADRVAAKVSM
jgi:small subunit ribosomal protein S19e